MNDCTPLDGAERERFAIAESLIVNGLRTIRDEHLSREEFSDFAAYCRLRWALDIHDSPAYAILGVPTWTIEESLMASANLPQKVDGLQSYVSAVAAKFASNQSRVVLLMLALTIGADTTNCGSDPSKVAIRNIAFAFIDGMFQELVQFALPVGEMPDFSVMIKARRTLERVAFVLDHLRETEASK